MLGMIRVRVDASAPRARVERLETLGGVSFQTSVLQVRNADGIFDGLMMRQSIRLLAMRGVTKAAAPDVPYIKELLERYHIERLTHTSLMRQLAPQIMDHVLAGASDGAVLLYARHVDADVLAAARYAAKNYRTLVLDLGNRGEAVRRRLLDETGTAALMEQLRITAAKTVVLLFDRTHPSFRIRMPRAVSVALGVEEAKADFNDACVCSPLYEPLGDTDREAVLGAVASRNTALVRGLQITHLVKK